MYTCIQHKMLVAAGMHTRTHLHTSTYPQCVTSRLPLHHFHAYICVYLYRCTNICVHVYLYMYVCIHIYHRSSAAASHACMHIYICVYIYTYTCVCSRIHIHTCVSHIHIFTYIHTHTYTYIYIYIYSAITILPVICCSIICSSRWAVACKLTLISAEILQSQLYRVAKTHRIP